MKKVKKTKTIVGKQKVKTRVRTGKSSQAKKSKKSSFSHHKNLQREISIPKALLHPKKPKNKKELYELQKKWDNILKKDGFNDIEFRQNNGEMSDYIKKPLYERKHNKISVEDIQQKIDIGTEKNSVYRRWGWIGEFPKFVDQLIWYMYYEHGLSSAEISKKLTKLLETYGFKKLKKVITTVKESDVRRSLALSRHICDKHFYEIDGLEGWESLIKQ